MVVPVSFSLWWKTPTYQGFFKCGEAGHMYPVTIMNVPGQKRAFSYP